MVKLSFPSLEPSNFTPPRKAVVFLVVAWLLWLVLALRWVVHDTKEPFNFFCLMVLPLVLNFKQRASNTKRKCSTNLWSTVITLVVTVVLFPVLYQRFWFRDRTRGTIEISQDSLVRYIQVPPSLPTMANSILQETTRFPSIAILQRSDWTSQANLAGSVPGKCFIGWYDERSPDCEELPPGTTPCQCAGSWAKNIVDFQWHNTSYRAQILTSTSSMVSNAPTNQMIVQTFFTYNTAKALADSSHILSPSLFIAVYDPTLTLQQALENGFTRLNLVNANGVAAINLGLSYRDYQYIGKPPAYDYTLSISGIPGTDLRCDVSSPEKNTGHCFLSLFMQFPTFDRLVFTQKVAMSYEELLSVAGSWFAVSQLLGWILSGLALHAS
ncbi:hypothetical protein QBC37DRAFT_437796 [Rhypophila decipiens]|uniref:Uncharacterized protein n=1 Tax=Rhypophila decipiens TaxID=261697 RepID=A0AAN6YE98_9PEZI|nr:hypothetical protein QBC37DRAFT_437796 [Rhypophila decipiens]